MLFLLLGIRILKKEEKVAMPEVVEASLRLGAAALEAAGVDEDRRRALFEDLSAENYAKMRGFRK